jgi:hypothetical protein
MSIFASYFWLWSIIGLVGLAFLYTLGAVMNLVGFVTPIKRLGRWLEDAPVAVKMGMVFGLAALLVYPSMIHRLWADATAHEIRKEFQILPTLPGTRPGLTTEQMNGLYDPTGTDGTYIAGTYGTAAPFAQVREAYERALVERGWVRQATGGRGTPGASQAAETRDRFRDHPDPARARYEIVVGPLPPGSAQAGEQLAGEPTVYAVHLGVVDPRLTTQVSWFIDCLVRRAPTFPTCEAMGWNPLEEHIGIGGRQAR